MVGPITIVSDLYDHKVVSSTLSQVVINWFCLDE